MTHRLREFHPSSNGGVPLPPPKGRAMNLETRPQYAPRTRAILEAALRKVGEGRPRASVTPKEKYALYADPAFAARMRAPEEGEEGWCVMEGVLFVVQGENRAD